MQKVVKLINKLDLVHKRIAIIADEAHRTHVCLLYRINIQGSTSTDKLHSILTGQKDQSNLLTYFSFTCTPTEKALELFGTETEEGNKLPFTTYTTKEAMNDGIILDVLKDYTYVNIPIPPSDNNNKDRAMQIAILKKARYILDHYRSMLKRAQESKFTPKSMIVGMKHKSYSSQSKEESI